MTVSAGVIPALHSCPQVGSRASDGMTRPLREEGLRGRGLPHQNVGCQVGAPARPIRHVWEAPMGLERTSVGLDVHARSVSAAAIDGVTGELITRRLVPTTDTVIEWVRSRIATRR